MLGDGALARAGLVPIECDDRYRVAAPDRRRGAVDREDGVRLPHTPGEEERRGHDLCTLVDDSFCDDHRTSRVGNHGTLASVEETSSRRVLSGPWLCTFGLDGTCTHVRAVVYFLYEY